MLDTKSSPKPGKNTWLWLLEILSGLLIIVILLIHFLVNHLLAPQGLLSYAEVMAYYQNPIVPIMEAFFLVFLVIHSLTGVRGIILDLNPSQVAMRALDWFLLIFGVVTIGYGAWLLLAVVAQGSRM